MFRTRDRAAAGAALVFSVFLTSPFALAGPPNARFGGPAYTGSWPGWYSPSHYGYPLDDTTGGYFGGGRYREYYNYGRGPMPAPSNYPGPLPPNPLTFKRGPKPYPPYLPPAPPHSPGAGETVSGPAPVQVLVQAPEGAEIWFDGTQTTQTGGTREFHSPPLAAGRAYTYEIRARWKEGERVVDQTQEVSVYAGQRAVVTFPAPAGSPSPAPAEPLPFPNLPASQPLPAPRAPLR